MGQAKQRGTQADREAQAKAYAQAAGLQPITVDELRAKHNLPPDAVFEGFVVWIRDRDEFLVRLLESSGVTTRAYGKLVDQAVRFDSFHDALPHAQASKNFAIVAAAFDIGDQTAIVGG